MHEVGGRVCLFVCGCVCGCGCVGVGVGVLVWVCVCPFKHTCFGCTSVCCVSSVCDRVCARVFSLPQPPTFPYPAVLPDISLPTTFTICCTVRMGVQSASSAEENWY